MKKEWKIYIKGIPGRGKEVIKALTNLGANNCAHYTGRNPHCLFYISHKGVVDWAPLDSETGQIIIDYYKEIKLPEQWKDGDILYSNDLGKYVVCSDNFKWGEQIAYITVSQGGSITTLENFSTRAYHLANPEEIGQFHKILHNLGKDWNAEKKQLVKWRWKPKVGETYWTVGINFFTWKECPTDIQMFDCGNCFKTEEEAEIAMEKIKKLMKGE